MRMEMKRIGILINHAGCVIKIHYCILVYHWVSRCIYSISF